MSNASVFAVKVLRPGRKQWWFLSAGGRTNHLRVHACQFRSREQAESVARDLERDNPGIKASVEPFA
jgi:hypothetical protein